MKYFATFKTNGERITSYVEGVHDDIPTDAIEITEEDQTLYSTNEYIRDMETGKPQRKPPYVPTAEELLNAYRAKRDSILASTDKIMILPDYTISGQVLTAEQRKELTYYRQQLREAPEKTYPNWPVVPGWLL